MREVPFSEWKSVVNQNSEPNQPEQILLGAHDLCSKSGVRITYLVLLDHYSLVPEKAASTPSVGDYQLVSFSLFTAPELPPESVIG